MQTTYRTIVTAHGPRRALVVSPDDDEVIGPQTLEELRSGCKKLHHEQVAAVVLADAEPVHAVVLRARGAEGSGQFRMARELNDGQLEDAGYLLARAQLNAWRPMLDHGVLAFARVELRVWELAAMRSGTARLLDELDARRHDPTTSAEDRQRAIDDHRAVSRAILHFGVGLDTALSELLPARLLPLESPDASVAGQGATAF